MPAAISLTKEILITGTDLALNAAPIRPEWILGGDPVARNRVISKSQDGTAITLLWDCSAGDFNWVYDTDETLYIIEGEATLTDCAGTRTIRAGDVVFFAAGSAARWHVETYVRKVAVFRYALPKPVGLAVKIAHRARMAVMTTARQALYRLSQIGAGRRRFAPVHAPVRRPLATSGERYASVAMRLD